MIGFARDRYQLEERTSPYQLTIEVLSPPQSLVSTIRLVVTSVDGTATSKLTLGAGHTRNTVPYLFVGGSDYFIETGPSNEKILTHTNQRINQTITLQRDGIVLEEEETFNLQLQRIGGQQLVAAFQNTAITIIDGDRKCAQSQDGHSISTVFL